MTEPATVPHPDAEASEHPEVATILVVGAGVMGAQIGMACALAGYRVTIQDIAAAGLDRAEANLRSIVDGRVAKGRITAETRDKAFANLSFTCDLEPTAAEADLVIEAVVEDLDVKRALFARLDELCPPHTILASNSSSYVPSKLAEATSRPDRVCNIHFFQPALVMTCVEIVRGPATADATVEAARAVARRLGKEPVVIAKEINGFIANRILGAIRDEAVFLLEGGYASITDIDAVCRTALGHPKGPFELQDMTGLDIGYAAKLGRFAESGHPADAPSRSLAERVEGGHLGRKTGRGWYRYDDNGNKVGEA